MASGALKKLVVFIALNGHFWKQRVPRLAFKLYDGAVSANFGFQENGANFEIVHFQRNGLSSRFCESSQ